MSVGRSFYLFFGNYFHFMRSKRWVELEDQDLQNA
jgi:hypothetical protein